jgi:hypothetical protein
MPGRPLLVIAGLAVVLTRSERAALPAAGPAAERPPTT